MHIFRRTGVFCVLALLLCSAFGCASPQPPQPPEPSEPKYRGVYWTGVMDNGREDIYSLWAGKYLSDYQDVFAPKEMTVKFNGKRYTGRYEHTELRRPTNYPVHLYQGDDGAFFINAETGELTAFDLNGGTEAEFDPQAYRSVADAFAEQYISPSEYTVTVTQYGPYRCRYEYCRQVDGYRTSDRMEVWVRSDGIVSNFYLCEPRAFEGITTVAVDVARDLQMIKDAIVRKSKTKPEETGCEIIRQELVRLDDGTVAMLYDIDVKYYYSEIDENKGFIGSWETLFVTYDV